MRTPSMTSPRKRMIAAGRIPPKAHPCLYGHVGPFTPRPDLTEWIQRLMPGSPPQVDCACGSSISAEVAR